MYIYYYSSFSFFFFGKGGGGEGERVSTYVVFPCLSRCIGLQLNYVVDLLNSILRESR